VPVDRLVCLGLSYRTAPVELRQQLGALAPSVDRCPAVQELVPLSTCYRVELYAHMAPNVPNARATLVEMLAAAHDVDRDDLDDHLYVFAGDEAVRHLYGVACGLDSLVLGEAEILGQVGGALEAADGAGIAGPVLRLLFESAVRAGRRARAETRIGASPATASSMGLALARETLGDLRGCRVLVVGLGQVGLQALKVLRGQGVTQIGVANRSRRLADEVAATAGGRAFGLDELREALAWADVVVTATGAPETVIVHADVAAALAERPERPLVLVDLAVPRDVDPTVGRLPGARVFDVDDLRAGLDAAAAARAREVPRVEAVVADEAARFSRRRRELDVEPFVTDLRRRADAIRERELERTLRHLGDVDPETARHLRHLSESLVNKLLHEPTARLREKAGEGEADELLPAFRELFGLAQRGS